MVEDLETIAEESELEEEESQEIIKAKRKVEEAFLKHGFRFAKMIRRKGGRKRISEKKEFEELIVGNGHSYLKMHHIYLGNEVSIDLMSDGEIIARIARYRDHRAEKERNLRVPGSSASGEYLASTKYTGPIGRYATPQEAAKAVLDNLVVSFE